MPNGATTAVHRYIKLDFLSVSVLKLQLLIEVVFCTIKLEFSLSHSPQTAVFNRRVLPKSRLNFAGMVVAGKR